MLRKIKDFIHAHKLVSSGERILVACSGGPDSLALLHIFLTLQVEYDVRLAVGHVDHMFRGNESAREAEYVRCFCQEHNVICHSTAIDVPRIIAGTGQSAQMVAREVRYAYLRQIANEMGGATIATGHHADDQCETVLQNLLRGAGSAGLRGMLPASEGIIRPLLGIHRAEIMEYCLEHNLSPQQDSSNAKVDYLRNSIRLELLPLLKERYNPSISEALCRTAVLMSAEHDFIRKTAEALYVVAARHDEASIFIEATQLQGVHVAIVRELFRFVIEKKHSKLTGITFWHVENMIDMLWNARAGATLDLPGNLMVRKGYEVLEFTDCTMRAVMDTGMLVPERQILVPGITYVDELNLAIEAKLSSRIPTQTDDTVLFDWDELQLPLTVRNRRNGDRLQPIGMIGSKKVKNLLIDCKVPRLERDHVPIICDQQTLLWVAGFRQSSIGRVSNETKQFLQLKIIYYEKRNGESYNDK